MKNQQSANYQIANSALLTDMYQLTMAQGYFHHKNLNTDACFYLFFREYPFHGGYAIACGIQQIINYIQNFKLDKQDLDYLRSLKNSAGKNMFSEDFLEYMAQLELKVDIDAVEEGSVVFPYEPVMRVTGPILHCQLIETALLNCFNFQTLIATKASRICAAANCDVMEFGLRRAQGYAGGV